MKHYKSLLTTSKYKATLEQSSWRLLETLDVLCRYDRREYIPLLQSVIDINAGGRGF